MRDKLRQRAIRNIVASILGSDRFSLSEVLRLCSYIEDEHFALQLSATLRNVAETIEATDEEAHAIDQQRLDPITYQISEVVARRRMSKHEFIELASEIFPPASDFLVARRMVMRELLDEFGKNAPTRAKELLLHRLQSTRPESDEYLQGIMSRDKGQR